MEEVPGHGKRRMQLLDDRKILGGEGRRSGSGEVEKQVYRVQGPASRLNT